MTSLSFFSPIVVARPLVPVSPPFLRTFPVCSVDGSPGINFVLAAEPELTPDLANAKPRTNQQQSLLDQLALEQKKWKPTGKPSTPSVQALTWALSEVENVNEIDAFLEGLYIPVRVFASVIQKLGISKKFQAAYCVYQWLQNRPETEERPNVYIYSSIMGAMKTNGNFDYFGIVLEEMNKSGIEPNIVTYNIIIASYEQQGLHSEAMNAFAELEQRGLQPTSMTYRPLLLGFEKLDDIHGALRMYSAAKDVLHDAAQDDAIEDLKRIVSSFCARFMRSCLRACKDPDYILDLLDEIEKIITNLCVRDYEDILWACGSRQRDYILAKKVMAHRRLSSPPVGVALCNHVMKILSNNKKSWAAVEVFEHMLAEGPAPNKDSYNIIRSVFNFLLDSSREKCSCSWSVRLLEKMEAHGILPDRFAWDNTLVTCAKKGDSAAAVLVFQKMIEAGHSASILSYGALLSALEKSGLHDKAEQVWEHMRRLGVKPNIIAYTTMISVYGGLQKTEELMRLVDEMRAAGVQFTNITYNALITTCAKVGDWKGALNWMQQLRIEGFIPDSVAYNKLVKVLSEGGEAVLARDMCIEAKGLNLLLSESVYQSVIEACTMHKIDFDLDAMRGQSSMASENTTEIR